MTEIPPPVTSGPRTESLRAQTKITVEDPHTMVRLLGAGDELLRLVERAVTSDVHVRGNEITITGAPFGGPSTCSRRARPSGPRRF